MDGVLARYPGAHCPKLRAPSCPSGRLQRVPDLLGDGRERLRVAHGDVGEDLPVEQVAEILECSAGTVRSQASRGLVDLRAVLGDDLAARLPGGLR